MRNILNEYKNIFPYDLPSRLSYWRWIHHKIKITLRSTSPCNVTYKLIPYELKICKAQMKDILENGFIQSNASILIYEEKWWEHDNIHRL